MTVFRELLDERPKGGERSEDLPGNDDLIEELKFKLMMRRLGGRTDCASGP